MRMNSVLGKKILSIIRDGVYAHPGGRQAVDMAFEGILPDNNRRILDVGCGLGGTSNYVQSEGYGKVTGIDIDKDSISYCRKHYPKVDFILSGADEADKKIQCKYDLFYHFCSFYVFPDHIKALHSLRNIANEPAELIIFDYADSGNTEPKQHPIVNPLKLDKIQTQLKCTGWKLDNLDDISEYFLQSYINFIEDVYKRRDQIVDMADEKWFDFVIQRYSGYVEDYKLKKWKAIILKASTN